MFIDNDMSPGWLDRDLKFNVHTMLFSRSAPGVKNHVITLQPITLYLKIAFEWKEQIYSYNLTSYQFCTSKHNMILRKPFFKCNFDIEQNITKLTFVWFFTRSSCSLDFVSIQRLYQVLKVYAHFNPTTLCQW